MGGNHIQKIQHSFLHQKCLPLMEVGVNSVQFNSVTLDLSQKGQFSIHMMSLFKRICLTRIWSFWVEVNV